MAKSEVPEIQEYNKKHHTLIWRHVNELQKAEAPAQRQ